MIITYDVIDAAFLSKITEYKFTDILQAYSGKSLADSIVDGYMKRAITSFNKTCVYDLTKHDDDNRQLTDDFEEQDVDEIVDIVSEGMVLQWMKPYLYSQDLLENALNTADFTTYSPAQLLLRVGGAYERVQHDYTQMIREYSYNHGDLSELHI